MQRKHTFPHQSWKLLTVNLAAYANILHFGIWEDSLPHRGKTPSKDMQTQTYTYTEQNI